MNVRELGTMQVDQGQTCHIGIRIVLDDLPNPLDLAHALLVDLDAFILDHE
jgi:hypothetical protein